MELKDYKNIILERSMNFLRDNMGGTIIKTADETKFNAYGVYIPRIFMGIKTDKGPVEDSINLSSGKCLNTTNIEFGEDTVISSNYVLLQMMRVYNLSLPKLALGEKVTVGIIDQDINSLYIKPYNRDQFANRDLDVMQMFVPASGKFDGKDLDDSNSYYVRCSSQSKLIRIHMSKANGEVSEYDITLDGSNGQISITDGNRSFLIDTNNDQAAMKNKAGTIISIHDDTAEITCRKYFVTAEDEIEFDTKKLTLKVENQIDATTKNAKFEFDNFKTKGDKLTEDYTQTEITNTKRKIKSDTTSYDGLVEVSKFLNANGGVGFGAPPGMSPLPTAPQISGQGISTFAGASGIPLVKAQQLLLVLQAIAAQADAAGSAGPTIVPPIASAMVLAMGQMIVSTTAKG